MDKPQTAEERKALLENEAPAAKGTKSKAEAKERVIYPPGMTALKKEKNRNNNKFALSPISNCSEDCIY